MDKKNPFSTVRLHIVISMVSAVVCLVLLFICPDLPKIFFLRLFVYVLILLALCSIIVALVSSRMVLKEMEDIYKDQRDFFANASHELKTPLAVVEANISVLEQDIPQNKWLDNIKTENNRMGRMVRDLLYLAREDIGAAEYRIGTFDLCSSINKAVLPFEAVAFEQKKDLAIQMQSQSISMVGDEEKIRQVVVILVDNAIKNSIPGAKINVSVEKDNKKALVKVHNTGQGIVEEDIKKIFQRFYRSQFSRSKYNDGNGLGLSIAKSIVDTHHGRIQVESSPGEYAQFTVVLPLGF